MKRILVTLLLIVVVVAAVIGWRYYRRIFKDNVAVEAEKVRIYIPSGAGFSTVLDTLEANQVLKDMQSFKWLARIKNYPAHVHSGHYILRDGTGNNALINMLRAGRQEPVKVTFNTVRRREKMAAIISRQIEADSAAIVSLMNDEEVAKAYGFNTETIKAMILPNTYEFYWDTDARGFLDRMHSEYKRFWNEERRQKAEEIGLKPYEVVILASLTQAEQKQHPDEWPIIAGVYINRLEKGMRLHSCPTLIYATGNFKIRRVLDEYKDYPSKYNTYKHSGLPPGPINFPETRAIDAVLNYDHNEYLYMCARDDFSGYHYFSKSLRQHNIYARRYQRKLNEKGIME